MAPPTQHPPEFQGVRHIRRSKLPMLLCLGFITVCAAYFFRAEPPAKQEAETFLKVTPHPVATDPSASQSGIFKITPQGDRTPLVVIVNGTEDQLRFQLMDSKGFIRTEWIDPLAERDLQVPSGDYEAQIDAPYDRYEIPTEGTVDVQDYHHYQADFVLVPDTGVPSTFHIGD